MTLPVSMRIHSTLPTPAPIFIKHNIRNRVRPQPLTELNGMFIALLMEGEYFEMGVNRRRFMAEKRRRRMLLAIKSV